MIVLPRFKNRLRARYIGIGDVLPGAKAYYGLRAYTAAYAARRGAALDLRRASDNAVLTIGFLPNGRLDIGHVAAWSGGSDVAVSQAYDHTGNGNHIVQATAANQPLLIFFPLYLSLTTSSMALLQSSATPASALISLTAVAQRSTGTGTCVMIMDAGTSDNNRISGVASTGTWRLYGGGGSYFNINAAEGAWHAISASIASGSTAFNIDGSDNTGGFAVGNTTAGNRGISGAASTTMLWREAGIWEALTLSVGQRSALVTNMRNAWAVV